MVFQMMSMKAKGEVKRNSDQKMTIPAGTVVAYSVIKMTISSDGYIGQWHLKIELHKITAKLTADFLIPTHNLLNRLRVGCTNKDYS